MGDNAERKAQIQCWVSTLHDATTKHMPPAFEIDNRGRR
jgi:hypothetical protein